MNGARTAPAGTGYGIMLQVRTGRGSTLAIVLAAMMVLVGMAVGFLLIGKLLGANKELQIATNTGGLAVARDAAATSVELPDAGAFQSGVGAPGSTPYDNFHLLVEEQPWIRGAAQPEAQRAGSQKHPVKLENYNLLAGQSLLVALNAAALQDYARREFTTTGAKKQSGDAPYAEIHRQWLTDALQGVDGMGKRLSVRLHDFDKKTFEKFAKNNSVRLAGSNATITSKNSGSLTSYIDQDSPDSKDVNCTNLEVTEDLSEEIPAGLLIQRNTTTGETEPVTSVHGKKRHKDGCKMYLRGYTDYRGPGGNTGQFNFMLPVTVPLEPNGLAHLVSKKDFVQGAKLVDTDLEAIKASIPPNAFASLAETRDHTSNKDMSTVSYARTGARNELFMSIPYGYIEICNGYVNPQDPGAALKQDRKVIFQRDPHLPKPGDRIYVYLIGGNAYVYSRTQGVLERVIAANNGGAPLSDADTGRIFTSSGFSATRDVVGLLRQEGAAFAVTLTEPPEDGDISVHRFPNPEDRDNRIIAA